MLHQNLHLLMAPVLFAAGVLAPSAAAAECRQDFSYLEPQISIGVLKQDLGTSVDVIIERGGGVGPTIEKNEEGLAQMQIQLAGLGTSLDDQAKRPILEDSILLTEHVLAALRCRQGE